MYVCSIKVGMRFLVASVLLFTIAPLTLAQEPKLSIEDIEKWIYVQKLDFEKAAKADSSSNTESAKTKLGVHPVEFRLSQLTGNVWVHVRVRNNADKPVTELIANVNCSSLKLPRNHPVKLQQAINPSEEVDVEFDLADGSNKTPVKRHNEEASNRPLRSAQLVCGCYRELRDSSQSLPGRNKLGACWCRHLVLCARCGNLLRSRSA